MRKNKDQYYLDIAREVAKRGTCLRRNYGAVIVNNDEIVATGYNGSPRAVKNCCDSGICIRKQLNIKPGQNYEMCKSVHAEQNAIISAGRNKTLGSILYLAGIDSNGNSIEAEPCMLCKKFIINAGICYVVAEHKATNVVDYMDDIERMGD